MDKMSILKKFIKFVSVSVLVLIKLAFLLYIGFILLFISNFDTTYYIFGKNRKAEMEDIFGITVTDDIKLKKYEEFGWLSFDYRLDISNIDDYNKFMQDNVKGKIIKKAENGIVYDYVKNTQEVSDYYEKDEIVYYYKWDGNTVGLEFYDHNKDGYYSAHLKKRE